MLGREARLEKAFEMKREGEIEFRALIVDRDTMSSSLLADALNRQFRCVAVGLDSADVAQVLNAHDVDVLVISADINGSSSSGLELSRTVSSRYPGVPIVLLLDRVTRETVFNAFRSGASGVFHRQGSMSKCLNCIDHVRRHRIWAEGEEARFLLEALRTLPFSGPLAAHSFGSLTARELEVVQCASKGRTNKRIAQELSLSEHTVKNYLSRAFEKLGVSSRIELLFFLTVFSHSNNISYCLDNSAAELLTPSR